MLLGAFAFIELRQRSPMFDFHLFRVPTFTGAQTTAFAISAGMFSMFLFLTLYLQNVVGNSAVKTGVIFLPLTLTSFVVAPLAGRLSARFPVRWFLGGGLAIVGVALLLMHGLTLSSTASTLIPGFIVGGIGDRSRQRASRRDRGQRRRAAARRDGVGDQQHVPPGRDRDWDCCARRDLPEPDRVEPSRSAFPDYPCVGAVDRLWLYVPSGYREPARHHSSRH